MKSTNSCRFIAFKIRPACPWWEVLLLLSVLSLSTNTALSPILVTSRAFAATLRPCVYTTPMASFSYFSFKIRYIWWHTHYLTVHGIFKPFHHVFQDMIRSAWNQMHLQAQVKPQRNHESCPFMVKGITARFSFNIHSWNLKQPPVSERQSESSPHL